LGLSRVHRNDVGAELGKLGNHETVYALTDRSQQNHRRNADSNAKCTE
jgi:hypothetical protein